MMDTKLRYDTGVDVIKEFLGGANSLAEGQCSLRRFHCMHELSHNHQIHIVL